MTVKIVTDSTSDITSDLAQEMGITVLPLTVSFGHESFLDRVTMTTDEFYYKLAHDAAWPTTTQPSPGDFVNIYSKLAEETDEILAIVISSKLSGTYQSAMNAKGSVREGCRIEVVDSLTTTMGLGLIAIAAAKASQTGATLDELTELARQAVPRAHPVMIFDTLKYLAKGGRIGKAQGLLGSLLSVRPILTTRDGEVSPLTKVRSRTAGMDYLCSFVAGCRNIQELAVEHATTPEDADRLVERLSPIYPRERIYRSTISPVLGTYMGPSVLSVSVLEGKEGS